MNMLDVHKMLNKYEKSLESLESMKEWIGSLLGDNDVEFEQERLREYFKGLSGGIEMGEMVVDGLRGKMGVLEDRNGIGFAIKLGSNG